MLVQDLKESKDKSGKKDERKLEER